MVLNIYNIITARNVHGNLGGKVNILEGDNIGHCGKKKSSHEHGSISEWLPRQRYLNLQI